MGFEHDEMAAQICGSILEKIRQEDVSWKQIFSSSIFRVGDMSWPRPDFVCEDEVLNATYAFEFKPPNQTKREYLTGLGQSFSYLQKHNYSALVLPKTSDDNYQISKHVLNLVSLNIFENIPLSIIEYDPDNILDFKIIKPITEIRRAFDAVKNLTQDTFWCWWRDLSNFELFELLKLSDKYRDISAPANDIYTKYIWPGFEEMLFGGKTLTWEGQPRIKKWTEASSKAEKQNSKIPLFQLDLWNQADGKITLKGYKLLTIGKLYGPGSNEFMDFLTYLILIDGKHLELIREVESFQKMFVNDLPENSKDFLKKLDEYLTTKGFIGKRKPSAVTTNSKETYIRDEPKLWNKLGILEDDSGRYFKPRRGYAFNLNRITQIVMKSFNF